MKKLVGIFALGFVFAFTSCEQPKTEESTNTMEEDTTAGAPAPDMGMEDTTETETMDTTATETETETMEEDTTM